MDHMNRLRMWTYLVKGSRFIVNTEMEDIENGLAELRKHGFMVG